MPPVAPVTSAVLPVRSNIDISRGLLRMIVSRKRGSRFPGSCATRGLERRDVVRRSDRDAGGAVGDALDRPVSTLPAPTS